MSQGMNAERLRTAGLWALATLQGVMTAALFTQTPPHPPLTIAPFAMAPFLAASLAVNGAAISLSPGGGRGAAWVSLAAGLLALVSFGPQKWLSPLLGQFWPAVLVGELAAILVIWFSLRSLRAPNPA